MGVLGMLVKDTKVNEETITAAQKETWTRTFKFQIDTNPEWTFDENLYVIIDRPLFHLVPLQWQGQEGHAKVGPQRRETKKGVTPTRPFGVCYALLRVRSESFKYTLFEISLEDTVADRELYITQV